MAAANRLFLPNYCKVFKGKVLIYANFASFVLPKNGYFNLLIDPETTSKRIFLLLLSDR